MRIGDLWRRLRFLVAERYFASDLEDEMRLHIHLRERSLIDRGAAPDVARHDARQRFGRAPDVGEQSRDGRFGAAQKRVEGMKKALEAINA